MIPADCRVRRATLDDLPQLMGIWGAMQFPLDELSRRVTEFQVATGPAEEVLGAIGLQIAERQGLIHSEGFADFAMAEGLRPMFWERLHSVATNHGLVRLWTQEEAPFWSHCGLGKAGPEALEKLPAAWRGLGGGWLALKLKEDIEEVISADREFALFMEAERQRTARTFGHARALKLLATLLALGLLLFVILGAIMLLRKNPQLLHP